MQKQEKSAVDSGLRTIMLFIIPHSKQRLLKRKIFATILHCCNDNTTFKAEAIEISNQSMVDSPPFK